MTTMFKFKLRYCKKRMTAFIHGELPPHVRRRIGRYIDECPDCYAEYLRQRELARDLERGLPSVGMPCVSQLDRIWAGVQAELSNTPPPHRPARRYSFSYGMAVVLMAVMVVLPGAVAGQHARMNVPSQPAPELQVLQKTPTSQAALPVLPTAVAVASTEDSSSVTVVLLQNTPEATP